MFQARSDIEFSFKVKRHMVWFNNKSHIKPTYQGSAYDDLNADNRETMLTISISICYSIFFQGGKIATGVVKTELSRSDYRQKIRLNLTHAEKLDPYTDLKLNRTKEIKLTRLNLTFGVNNIESLKEKKNTE